MTRPRISYNLLNFKSIVQEEIMKKYFYALCFASFMGLAHAETINYEGSSTIGKFIEDAAKVYAASTFTLNTIPESSGGEQCAMRGNCAMGGVAREVEQRFLDSGVVATLIAKDAIAAVVNENNPVKELTLAQLKAIFTGQVKNWSALGGDDIAIKPYVVKETSATYSVFAKAVLGNDPYQGVEVITPDAKMIPTIARERGAIGQLSFSFLPDAKGVRALKVEGHEATVQTQGYPISRPLYIVTKGQPQGEVKHFLTWVLSPAGQQIVKQRFVGVGAAH